MLEFYTKQEINEVFKLTIPLKIAVIQNTIIPLMNLRRGRFNNLSAEDINKKLRNPPRSEKPGESAELSRELLLRENEGIDVEIAGELADIAYYGLQLNAQSEDSLNNLYESELIGFVGIPLETVLDFCIIKYSTRLDVKKGIDSKEKEYTELQKYLDLHPELKELWKDSVTPIPVNSITIWEHISGERW